VGEKIPYDPAMHLNGANQASPSIPADLSNAAWALIQSARRIALIAHEHPDGDTIGSALGLSFALLPLGKCCIVACADPTPAIYHFLPGSDTVQTDLPAEDFDLVIALDAGELSRFGSLYARHRAFLDRAIILNFDHHVTSHGCGIVNIIDPLSAATAELVTLFLLDHSVPISREAATCLLTGIITDTRAFEYTSTTARTLETAAALMRAGAVPAEIVKPVYRLKPLAQVRLWALILKTMATAADNRIIWAEMTQQMLVEAGATGEMDEGIAGYLIDIYGAEISAFFKEHTDGTIKVSLRTVEPYDSAAIAAHFGGGGHLRAAGFSLNMDLPAAKALVVPYLESVVSRRPPAADNQHSQPASYPLVKEREADC
jgi:phosphoesterase RecJ-like protein